MENNGFFESGIYLDYNSTTPLAKEVLDGINSSLLNDWGNPSSINPYGVKAKSAISKARIQVAEMLNCSPSEIIFTSGGTETNNMIIYSILKYFEDFRKSSTSNFVLAKPHVITSNVEHDSIILPLRYLEDQSLVTLSVVRANDNGCIVINDVLSQINDYTSLITIMYANNETGVIMPIPELGKQLSLINANREKSKKIKILFHTDAAQIIGKEPVNFQALNVDFMTVVGHKFYGPRIGCLCKKTHIFPLLYGGGQEYNIRPGTENTPMIVGLGIAAQLVTANIKEYKNHMLKCREKLEAKLKEVFRDKIIINCQESFRLPNTTSIAFKDEFLEGNLVLSRCNKLLASIGAACHGTRCSQILINSGIPAELAKNSIRISVGRSTTFEEIQDAVADLKLAVEKVKVGSGNKVENV